MMHNFVLHIKCQENSFLTFCYITTTNESSRCLNTFARPFITYRLLVIYIKIGPLCSSYEQTRLGMKHYLSGTFPYVERKNVCYQNPS